MRGLTTEEHALLVFLDQPASAFAPVLEAEPHDRTYTVCEQLLACGRVEVVEDESGGWVWDNFEITTLGQLALKLWPATMARAPAP